MKRCIASAVLLLISLGGFGQFFERKIGNTLSLGQFRNPTNIAIDADGNSYVVDEASYTITKFNSTGTGVLRWGEYGTGDGQFTSLRGIAVGPNGSIYVVDNNRIQKFSSTGTFITKWGTYGTGDKQFDYPIEVAVDANENVYVLEFSNNRIQKFNSSGDFITKWGSFGTGDSEFDRPNAIAIDATGNVYVADYDNFRIQKFNNSGDFITKWGSFGSGDGQFYAPGGIVVDAGGNIYVLEFNRIQKFSSSGTFITKWGTSGTGDGQFNSAQGVAIDAGGSIYIVDTETSRIQKFNGSGSFITKWGIPANDDGQFNAPNGITIDANGNVFVVDTGNNRIQKFNSAGVFVTKWGTSGTGNGQFNSPRGIAIDGSGNVYVADVLNNRIQKFNNAGVFITKWGTSGGGNGQFNQPGGIAIDGSGNVYVADTYNHRIQKFNSNGGFIITWGANGTGDGQFLYPEGIVWDGIGNLYVADVGNHRIQKFNSSGNFSSKWGTSGTGDGQFQSPYGIACSNGTSGPIYVTSSYHLLQKFDISGNYLGRLGTKGNQDGQFISPSGVTNDSEKNVYVVDSRKHQVQKFSYPKLLATSVSMGAPNDVVTLTGFFNLELDQNEVKFNGIKATITEGTTTSLKVVIPTDATTGKISVAWQGYTTSYSIEEFVILPFTIASFSPVSGGDGDVITITGSGFSSTAANNIVRFNGITASVNQASLTQLRVVVPEGASTGKLSVTIGSNTTYSQDDFKFNPLKITSLIYPDLFTVGSASENVTIGVNDIALVGSIKFIRNGISALPSAKIATDVPVPSSNLINISLPSIYFSDPIGLGIQLVVTNKEGLELVAQKNIYLQYPTSQSPVIPNLSFGKPVSNYKLISIPLILQNKNVSSVFKDLGPYDQRNWRLYGYSGISNRELNDQSIIETGKGYWLIAKNAVEIRPGSGTTVAVTTEDPYTITLSPGWNLIGNPYNLDLTWSSVLAFNNNPSGVGNLRHYENGSFSETSTLERFRGAFVRLTGTNPLELKIPVNDAHLSGGRIAPPRTGLMNSIESPVWEVNLVVDDGTTRNELPGIGMHPEALEVEDKWDEARLPAPEGVATFDMVMKEIQGTTLIKDVVKTSSTHTWAGTLTSQNGVMLSWDNSYFQDSETLLMLEAADRVELIDMRNQNTVILNKGHQSFKIHYGDEAYVHEASLTKEASVGSVYPNPFKRNSESISIPIALPKGTSQLEFSLTDMFGKQAVLSSIGSYESGRQLVSWKADFESLKSGLYLLRVSVQHETGLVHFYRKVIIE